MRLPILALASSLSLLAAAAQAEALTEAQARLRIEQTGYTQVTALRLDPQGFWHGRAARNGEPCDIRLNAQGDLEDAREFAALTMLALEAAETEGTSPR